MYSGSCIRDVKWNHGQEYFLRVETSTRKAEASSVNIKDREFRELQKFTLWKKMNTTDKKHREVSRFRELRKRKTELSKFEKIITKKTPEHSLI
jgi:transposase